MTLAQETRETERQLIDRIKFQYEANGYDFIVEPGPDQLPEFMGSYRPDAIAFKNGRKIAIEIKGRNFPQDHAGIEQIRKIFSGHEDWQLRVMFVAREAQPRASFSDISQDLARRCINEISKLVSNYHYQAALLFAWSLLEAVTHIVEPITKSRTYTSGSIIQLLSMNGHITTEAEQKLREVADLRNSVAHGDLEKKPSKSDIDTLVNVIITLLDNLKINTR